MGFLDVSAGQVIASAHMDLAISQSVMRFSSAAQRDQQLPAPTVGMVCYLTDVNIIQVFDNQIVGGANAWHPLGGLRMGYATMGVNQSIANDSVEVIVKLGTAGGAANRPGRSTWNANGTVTCPYSGTYLISGNVTWPANSSGERRCYIKRYYGGNWGFAGVGGGVAETNTGSVGSTYLRQGVTAMVVCNAGDQLGMWVSQSANANLTLVGGNDGARLGVHLLGSD